MPRVNKKGMAPATIGELILVVAVSVLCLWVVLGITGYLSPTAASVGCGLNLRAAAATMSASTVKGALGNSWTFLGAPILMCNQYQTPVDINAANFKSCPGISDFCKSAKGDALVECWKQCARIQVDQLTNTCWTMAGSGRLDFKTTIWKGLSLAFTDGPTIVKTIVFGSVGYYVLGPAGAGIAVAGNAISFVISVEKSAKILRCFRYRIVNPIIGPDRQPIDYADESYGRSWTYGLNTTKVSSSACRPSTDDPFCSYGGTGVASINAISTGTNYTINGNTLRLPENFTLAKNAKSVNCYNFIIPTLDVKKFAACYQVMVGGYLNYNISDPRNQVCYIAYYQGGSGKNFVIRSCKFWSEYASSVNYLN